MGACRIQYAVSRYFTVFPFQIFYHFSLRILCSAHLILLVGCGEYILFLYNSLSSRNLDTGSEANLISETVAAEIFPPSAIVSGESVELQGASGDPWRVDRFIYDVEILCEMTQRRVTLTLCVSSVCPSPGVVLGNAVARALGSAPSPLHFTQLHIDPASTLPPSIAATNVSSPVSGRILADIQDLLAVNKAITGFCTAPGGVFSWEWKGEPPRIHSRSYVIQYPLPPRRSCLWLYPASYNAPWKKILCLWCLYIQANPTCTILVTSPLSIL